MEVDGRASFLADPEPTSYVNTSNHFIRPRIGSSQNLISRIWYTSNHFIPSLEYAAVKCSFRYHFLKWGEGSAPCSVPRTCQWQGCMYTVLSNPLCMASGNFGINSSGHGHRTFTACQTEAELRSYPYILATLKGGIGEIPPPPFPLITDFQSRNALESFRHNCLFLKWRWDGRASFLADPEPTSYVNTSNHFIRPRIGSSQNLISRIWYTSNHFIPSLEYAAVKCSFRYHFLKWGEGSAPCSVPRTCQWQGCSKKKH